LGGHFSNALGGAEYQAGCIADALVSTGGFDVHYLARAIDSSYSPKGYRLVQISKRNFLNRHAFFFDAIDLYKILNEIQPDIIYQRGLLAYTGVAAYYARNKRSRLVFHIASDFDVSPSHNNCSPKNLFKLIDRKIGEYGIRRADAIVAQTQQQADLLKSNFGKEVAAVIGNFHPLPDEIIDKREPVKVIWVGNFKPNKRPELFVRLAGDLRHWHGVEFVMMGHPGNLQRYSDMNRKIRELNNIEFLGLQPLAKVNELLARGHIFVNTSSREGFPNTFIQAWMRSVPVVSLDVDIDGLLAGGTVGFLSGSYTGLRDDVERLLKEPDLRNRIGLQASEYAVANHSLGNFKELLRVIRG